MKSSFSAILAFFSANLAYRSARRRSGSPGTSSNTSTGRSPLRPPPPPLAWEASAPHPKGSSERGLLKGPAEAVAEEEVRAAAAWADDPGCGALGLEKPR